MSEIRTKISVDSTKVKSGLDAAKNSVSSWAKDVRSQVMGAFAAGAIVNSVKETADRLSQIGDAASRNDFGVESMQALALMAKQANIELGATEKLLNSLADAQISVASGENKQNTAALESLGMSRDQVNQMTPEQFMLNIVKALNTKNISGRANIQDALPFLNSKMAGILNSLMDDLSNFDEYIKKHIADRSIASEQEVASIKATSDNLETSWTSLKNSLIPFVTILVRIIDTIVTVLNELVSGVRAVGKLLGIAGAKWVEKITNVFTGKRSQKDISTEYDRQAEEYVKTLDFNRISKIWSANAKPPPAPAPINLKAKAAEKPEEIKSKDVKALKQISIYSDSLLSKGNMLGQTHAGYAVDIARQELMVAKRMLEIHNDTYRTQEDINRNIKRISDTLNYFTIAP